MHVAPFSNLRYAVLFITSVKDGERVKEPERDRRGGLKIGKKKKCRESEGLNRNSPKHRFILLKRTVILDIRVHTIYSHRKQ